MDRKDEIRGGRGDNGPDERKTEGRIIVTFRSNYSTTERRVEERIEVDYRNEN